jgi:hypothetical protein
MAKVLLTQYGWLGMSHVAGYGNEYESVVECDRPGRNKTLPWCQNIHHKLHELYPALSGQKPVPNSLTVNGSWNV